MTNRLKIGIAFVAIVAILGMGTLLTATALAQEETPTTPEEDVAPAPRMWGGHGRGMRMDDTALEAAAEALGMTADELSTQLWGGQTLADLAEEQGVDLADVQAAVEAAQEQAVRDAIEGAVEDGDLTRDHADWLLEGLDNGYWSGGRMGGFGGCGRGGFGHRGGPESFGSETGFGRAPAGRMFMDTDGV
jgi:hypothetical protein